MNLYFLRHGESEANAAGLLGGQHDAPLTEKGIQQATAAINAVKKLNPDVIYHSPLQRAHKTAEIVAKGAGIENRLINDDRLKERGIGVIDATDNKGGTLKVSTTPDSVEGVETIAELRKRAQSFLNDIERKHDSDTVLAVGHGAHIKMMISILTDHEWDDISDVTLPNGVPFQSFEEVA